MNPKNIPAQNVIEAVIRAVCSAFGCTTEEFYSGRRQMPLPDARKAVVYFLTQYTTMGASQMGRAIKRDHSSVVAAQKQSMAFMQGDRKFSNHIEYLRLSVANMILNTKETHCPTCGHKLTT